MKQLAGKRLLILGATSGEMTLVTRAQSMGVYVIVTDSHEDWDLAPAKKIADEAWNISWSDIEALEIKCRSEHIDGVTAGYSEVRVENLIKLCKKLNLPCYINDNQLEVTRDKIKFKETCRRNGVPTVKDYKSIEEVDSFPVIVKPVDRAGSIGISIANNEIELRKAFEYAMEKSVSKNVIIEQYINDTKIDVYYAVENGKITLISSCDTIPAKQNGLEKVCQSCWLYPMAELDSYLSKVDQSARKMIEYMEIKYGCIFFSGFVDKNENFVFFECGFRLEGAHQYNYTERKGPFNFLDLFIIHALTGNSELLDHTAENIQLKGAVINIYAKDGVIGCIDGIDQIRSHKDCCLVLVHGRIGEQCVTDKAILSKIVVMGFANENAMVLSQDIDYAYSKLSVLSENGSDMIFDRIDTKQVANWWY